MKQANADIGLAGIGRAVSPWIATTGQTSYPPLQEGFQADVAIIGGGMAGLSAAYFLKKKGFSVAVTEGDRIVEGVTGNTTAKITSLHDIIYSSLIRTLGHRLAHAYASANQEAVAVIRDVSRKEGIDCDFKEKNAFCFAEKNESVKKVKSEADAAARLGLPASYVRRIDFPLKSLGAVKFSGQAQFHPRKYLLGLARKIEGQGSRIFEKTRAVDLEIKENRVTIITEKGKLSARHAIIATNFPFYDKPGSYFARLYPVRSYAIASLVNKIDFSKDMFISAEKEGRDYRSLDAGRQELIIIGGEDHKAGQGGDTRQRYLALAAHAREAFGSERIAYRWSTQDNFTPDQIPYAGRITAKHKHVFVATGFGQWGMTNATISARIISDLISGDSNPWAQAFDPARFKPTRGTGRLISENLNAARQLVKGKLYGTSSIRLKPGDGAIVRAGAERVAASRDGRGLIHTVSPSCTHMGCTVSWNSAESSWDCPCHGSRFSNDGKVLHAPASRPLEKKSLKASGIRQSDYDKALHKHLK